MLRHRHARVVAVARVAGGIPVEPGRYFWTAWNEVVEVYAKRGGARGRVLWVRPNAKRPIEVKVTPRIAREFHIIPEGVTT